MTACTSGFPEPEMDGRGGEVDWGGGGREQMRSKGHVISSLQQTADMILFAC